MKTFNDLKVGDAIYDDFEKKDIVYIKPSRFFEDNIKIYTSDGCVYFVEHYLTSSSYYVLYIHGDGEPELIASDKEAIVQFYKDQIRDLRIEFEDNNARLEKILEKAKALK